VLIVNWVYVAAWGYSSAVFTVKSTAVHLNVLKVVLLVILE
jgi:hypothetical protein